jgi:hypothetical protein
VLPVNVATRFAWTRLRRADMSRFGIEGLSSMSDKTLSRRAVVAGLPFLLAGCAGGYGPVTGEHPLPFVWTDPGLLRQEVAYRAPYRPGTVVVNIGERRLYLGSGLITSS